MKDSEKKMIIILIIISVVVIGVLMLLARNKGGKETRQGNEMQVEEPKEEFVNVLEDGTKLNTSEALHQVKAIDGLEISDLQLTQKGNKTLLLGKVTNTTNTVQTKVINITLIDKTGKELETLPAYVEGVKPGESTELIVSCTLDYANAYDFKLSK